MEPPGPAARTTRRGCGSRNRRTPRMCWPGSTIACSAIALASRPATSAGGTSRCGTRSTVVPAAARCAVSSPGRRRAARLRAVLGRPGLGRSWNARRSAAGAELMAADPDAHAAVWATSSPGSWSPRSGRHRRRSTTRAVPARRRAAGPGSARRRALGPAGQRAPGPHRAAFACAVDMVIEVADELLAENAGRWRLRADAGAGPARAASAHRRPPMWRCRSGRWAPPTSAAPGSARWRARDWPPSCGRARWPRSRPPWPGSRRRGARRSLTTPPGVRDWAREAACQE